MILVQVINKNETTHVRTQDPISRISISIINEQNSNEHIPILSCFSSVLSRLLS